MSGNKKRSGIFQSKAELQAKEADFEQLYSKIDQEIEAYQGLNTTFLIVKLEELNALKTLQLEGFLFLDNQ